MKPDGLLGALGRFHERPQGLEHNLELPVVLLLHGAERWLSGAARLATHKGWRYTPRVVEPFTASVRVMCIKAQLGLVRKAA